jgi:hypothetical protein
MTNISLSDLETALQFLTDLELNTAYVSKKTGRIHIVPADLDAGEDVPEDLETSDEYVELPAPRDFDLGNQLAFRFIEQEIPSEYENVRNIFRHKGAYGRFRHLLESKSLFDRWHRFQEEQTQARLREWGEEHGLQVRE